MKALPIALAALWLTAGQASAETYGIATLQAGSLSYRTGAAIAKVATEKAGLQTLVQSLAGETVLIPMVGRGVIQFGLANIIEYLNAAKAEGKESIGKLRLVGAVHALQIGMFAKKGSGITTIAALKGKRIPASPAAQRSGLTIRKAMLASANFTQDDVKLVLVANLVRGADAFTQGKADAFSFAFGAPKIREVDVAVGGIQALEIADTSAAIAASRKEFPYGYLSEIRPGKAFVGVVRPMKVYTVDLVLFTNADVKNEVVYKLVEAMVADRAGLVAVAPHMRGFSAQALHKTYNLAYHPGALKYFADHKIAAVAFE